MRDQTYSRAFLIISRAQKEWVKDEGVMTHGSLSRIEHALLDSPRFQVVFRNRDATIFALARDSSGAPR
jgi:hypothetical protein